MDYENKDIKPFSLKGLETRAFVKKVIDGDSLQCVFEFPPGNLHRFSCRLANINAPEIRGVKDKTARAKGVESKNALISKIGRKFVSLKCLGEDKYRRLLVSINTEDENQNINQWLIDQNYATEYQPRKR